MKLGLFLAGIAVCALSHPKITRFFASRLTNEGIITPKVVKPENAEIIKFMGPNLSLFFIGAILILVSLILN